MKKKKVQEFLIFKIIEKSSYLIEYLGVLNQDELAKFNLNNVYYITPGKNHYELIIINSKGEIVSISIDINENKKLVISNFNSLLNIELNLNHKLSSDIIDFKPLYSKNSLNGIVLIENSIDVDENLWLFYKKPDNDILTFSTFVENELFLYYDFREVCHLFFLQDNQVWYLQFEDISEDSIEKFADILSLDETNPIIHDIFFYRNYLYIRTEDFLYKYHNEHLVLDKERESVDKSNFVKQSFKSPHILIGKKGELFIRNDPEAEPYIPIFINPDYDEIDLQYENSPKFISIFKSDLIIIKTKKELILASLFFDKRLTYIIKKRALKKFNFFEELTKKPKEFRERVESQLGFLKRSVELEIDDIESKTFRPPRIIQFFTKENDVELLNNLYITNTYDSFARKWKRNPSSVYFHVKGFFDIPRCDIHPQVKKTCKNCQERLSEWREDGLKKIETIKYRESLTAEVFSGVEKNYYTAFIRKKYIKRIQKTFEFYDLIPQELWDKTIDYIIPLSMEGHSFEVVLAFGLHEILESYYNITSYDSVINDLMFQYFLIIDREFHKYWKPHRINEFMQKHKSHIKKVEISNRVLRTQQLFVYFIYPKIKEDFFSFIGLLADKLSQLLRNNLLLSNQSMTTIVAGLFGKLYKLFPRQFQKKYTQSEISNELQITEVTLRKATKDKKNAILDNFINKCWVFYSSKNIKQSKKKDDVQFVFIDEISKRKSLKRELDEKKEDSKQELIEEIDLKELDIFDENGVFWCNCGKSYLSGQKRYILQHIKTCPEFNPKLKEIKKQSAKNKTVKGKQKKISNFFSLFSREIDPNIIIELLSNEWKSFDGLVNDLNITEYYDKRSLVFKLKELEINGEILSEIRDEEKYWKIKL